MIASICSPCDIRGTSPKCGTREAQLLEAFSRDARTAKGNRSGGSRRRQLKPAARSPALRLYAVPEGASGRCGPAVRPPFAAHADEKPGTRGISLASERDAPVVQARSRDGGRLEVAVYRPGQKNLCGRITLFGRRDIDLEPGSHDAAGDALDTFTVIIPVTKGRVSGSTRSRFELARVMKRAAPETPKPEANRHLRNFPLQRGQNFSVTKEPINLEIVAAPARPARDDRIHVGPGKHHVGGEDQTPRERAKTSSERWRPAARRDAVLRRETARTEKLGLRPRRWVAEGVSAGPES